MVIYLVPAEQIDVRVGYTKNETENVLWWPNVAQLWCIPLVAYDCFLLFAMISTSNREANTPITRDSWSFFGPFLDKYMMYMMEYTAHNLPCIDGLCVHLDETGVRDEIMHWRYIYILIIVRLTYLLVSLRTDIIYAATPKRNISYTK